MPGCSNSLLQRPSQQLAWPSDAFIKPAEAAMLPTSASHLLPSLRHLSHSLDRTLLLRSLSRTVVRACSAADDSQQHQISTPTPPGVGASGAGAFESPLNFDCVWPCGRVVVLSG